MDFTNIPWSDFIDVKLLVLLVLVLNAAGMFLKRIKSLTNDSITLILLPFGILLSIAFYMLNPDGGMIKNEVFNGFVQGLICTAIAVFGYEFVKAIKSILGGNQ